MSKRVITMKVLPGEPTDGSGRVCIHLFVQNASGPFIEPHVLHPTIGEDGQPIKQQVQVKSARGRLACDPKRTVALATHGNVITVTSRTDNPRAVTCIRCKASDTYAAIMKQYGGG